MVRDERDRERAHDRTRGERREQPDHEPGPGRELGEAGEPRVQDAGLHAETLEPPGRALDLAAPVDVVVAVGDHRDAHGDPQDQQPEPQLVGVHVLEHASSPPDQARTIPAARPVLPRYLPAPAPPTRAR